MPTLTSAERIGSLIAGKYEIRRLIGEGGFSAVFESVHTVTGRSVAIKILHSHLVATEQIRQRFLMEARAMARVSHDGIVQVLDAGEDDDATAYMVLELLSGEPLESTLSRVRLTWDETVNVGLDVLSALSEAHKHKIIHRDIKPGNIFIVHKSDGSSHAKLLDFGIAHVARVDGKPITQQGMILGTPEYMSPEQGRSGIVGPESDVWSVGIVLFECITGFTPFVAESTTEVLLKVATTSAPSLRALAPDVPAAIASVIDRSLERDLQLRYRTADQMREALLEARILADNERTSQSSPTPSPVPRREPAPTLGEAPAPREAVRKTLAEAPSPPPPPEPARVFSTTGLRSISVASPLRAPTDPYANARRGSNPDDSAERPSDPQQPRWKPGPPVLEEPPRASSPNVDNEYDPTASAPRSRTSDNGRDAAAEARRSAIGSLHDGDDKPEKPAQPPPRKLDETGNFRTNRTTFNAPPLEGARKNNLVVGGIAAAAVLGGLAWAALHGGPVGPVANADAEVRTGDIAVADATPSDANGADPHTVPAPESVLRRVFSLGAPGSTSPDQIAEFARHTVISPLVGNTQRVLATCVSSPEGASAYLYQLSSGAPLASSRGQVACSGFDLSVIADASGDGTDDVVAVAPGGAEVVVLDSRSMSATQRIALPGARGLVTGLSLDNEPVALVYTERAGLNGPSSVQAVMLNSRRVRWQVQGNAVFGRVGQPVELGLSVGPDASGDGVPDVAVGIGPVAGVAPQTLPERARCVQLFSGADGAAVWPQPFCQHRGGGSQSVSLGPDIDGDGRGDVAVGTDQPSGGDAPVVLLSGRDAHVIRAITPPPERAQGFGWPVALGRDFNGDGTPDLAVGTIGQTTELSLFDATTGRPFIQERLSGVGNGTLRLLLATGGVASAPSMLVVGDPGEGIRGYGMPIREP